jgi:hypothetical protein
MARLVRTSTSWASQLKDGNNEVVDPLLGCLNECMNEYMHVLDMTLNCIISEGKSNEVISPFLGWLNE